MQISSGSRSSSFHKTHDTPYIDRLPADILRFIFTLINDKKSASLVCKEWKVHVFEATLMERKAFANEYNKLLDLAKKLPSLSGIVSPKISPADIFSREELKDTLILLFKDCSKEKLDELDKNSSLTSLKNIFKLVKIHNQLNQNQTELTNIAVYLSNLSEVSRAIKVSCQILNPLHSSNSLETQIKIALDHPDRIQEIVQSISSSRNQYLVLCELVKYPHLISGAIPAISYISDFSLQFRFLSLVVENNPPLYDLTINGIRYISAKRSKIHTIKQPYEVEERICDYQSDILILILKQLSLVFDQPDVIDKVIYATLKYISKPFYQSKVLQFLSSYPCAIDRLIQTLQNIEDQCVRYDILTMLIINSRTIDLSAKELHLLQKKTIKAILIHLSCPTDIVKAINLMLLLFPSMLEDALEEILKSSFSSKMKLDFLAALNGNLPYMSDKLKKAIKTLNVSHM